MSAYSEHELEKMHANSLPRKVDSAGPVCATGEMDRYLRYTLMQDKREVCLSIPARHSTGPVSGLLPSLQSSPTLYRPGTA